MLKSLFQKQLCRFSSHSRKPTSPSLNTYDIVIIGANSGGILSSHLEKIGQGRYTVFLAYNNQINQVHHLNFSIDKGNHSIHQHQLEVKKILNPYTAHSDGVGVKQILPEENSVVLENGRRIGYQSLVISSGLQSDYDQIKGLQSALEDNGNPVFSSYDYSIKTDKKPHHYFYFNGGKSYFYIPPFPFRGEVQDYNFLAAYDQWENNQKKWGKQSKTNFQVINANSRFVQYNDQVNKFMIEELEKRQIPVLYNTQLKEIDSKGRKLVLFNAEKKQQTNLDYDNIFSLIPLKQNQFILDSGLASKESNDLLNINSKTLQHLKYKNIFGLGDVSNLPTTRSHVSAQHQINVVRNNVIRQISKSYLNAFYNGATKTSLQVGTTKLTFMKHFYDNQVSATNLVDAKGGVISYLRAQINCLLTPLLNILYYKQILVGPPYQICLKQYNELDKVPEDQRQKQQASGKYFPSTKTNKSV